MKDMPTKHNKQQFRFSIWTCVGFAVFGISWGVLILGAIECFLWYQQGFDTMMSKLHYKILQEISVIHMVLGEHYYQFTHESWIVCLGHVMMECVRWVTSVEANFLQSINKMTNQMSSSLRNQLIVFTECGIQLSFQLIQLTGLKILLVIAAIPCYVLFLVIGLSDGLMHRTIRQASLGRESAYLFHKLLMYLPQCLKLSFCTYILLTLTAVPSNIVLLILAVGLSFWTAQLTSRFKKYV